MILSRKLANIMIAKNVSADDMVETLRTYNLLSLLPSIKNIVAQSLSHSNKRDTISIQSPFALSDDAIVHIKKIVGDTSSPHEVIIKKDMLAGFKARYKGKLYDGSAERIIRQFTK